MPKQNAAPKTIRMEVPMPAVVVEKIGPAEDKRFNPDEDEAPIRFTVTTTKQGTTGTYIGKSAPVITLIVACTVVVICWIVIGQPKI